MLREALTLHQHGKLSEAATLYRQVLAQNPKNADALHLFGVLELQRNNPAASLPLLDRAIALKPQNADFHFNRGNVLQELKQYEEAVASYGRALAIKPDYADALTNQGAALSELARFDEALASYDAALRIAPQDVEALVNRGSALHRLARYDEALASYDRALAREPRYGAAWGRRGHALRELRRPEESLVSYDRALAASPADPELLSSRGAVLRDLKRLEEALASYDRALSVRPDFAEALNNRGAVLRNLKRPDEALASFDRALTLQPDNAEALSNRGNALADLKRLEEALACYDRALTLKPDFAEALNNRGAALKDLKRPEESLASYERALALRPDYPFLEGNCLHARMKVCHWVGLEEAFASLARRTEAGERASPPFAALAAPMSPALQRTCAEVYAREKHPPRTTVPFAPRNHQRIRLGYFSSDFHNHAVAFLIAELFERHDRTQFETIGFSIGPERDDAMRRRLRRAFDRFVDAGSLSDPQTVGLARELEIDIAIDLNGFTKNGRTDLFAERAAPLQANYLGYPGTMGAGYMDYLIADPTLIPPGDERHYAEKIIRLPDSYQANDSTRAISPRVFGRAECGLPEAGFVFCCFNNNYKITPAMFDVWMRLLRAVEGSVLWLLEDNASAARRLRAEAEARGVAAERLTFAPRVDPADHLARHRLADLFLDTLPYNAHTTASDALWAGLPVLTCRGETFAGRVAASLLGALGLDELIVDRLEDYETRARELAMTQGALSRVRAKLAAQRSTSPLFDTGRFTRQLESAYSWMWQRYQQGLPPEHWDAPRLG